MVVMVEAAVVLVVEGVLMLITAIVEDSGLKLIFGHKSSGLRTTLSHTC